MSTLETWGSTMMDLRNRLVDFQTQTDKIVDLLSLRTAVAANQSAMNVDQANPSLITGSQSPSSSSSFLIKRNGCTDGGERESKRPVGQKNFHLHTRL